LELVELAKTRYDLREGNQHASQPSIVFASNCRMEHSSFYKAVSIWIASCEPEIGKECPLKAFEFDRPIRKSDWGLITETILRELYESGNSDRFLQIGDGRLPDAR
jgi:hypothetical protein